MNEKELLEGTVPAGSEVHRSKIFGKCVFSGWFYSTFPLYLSHRATVEARPSLFRRLFGIPPGDPSPSFFSENSSIGTVLISHPDTFEASKAYLDPPPRKRRFRHY